MLLSLSVENFILIPQLHIPFDKGFSAITGETGAGKSILLGALGLVLGQRVDMGVLRDKDKKCTIEAAFAIKNYELEVFFTENELDYENTTLIRREITPQGKSRAFINDTPVNLNVLKNLGDKLIDIHSQHQTLQINESAFQLQLVDAYANDKEDVLLYKQQYKEYSILNKQLTDLQEQENKSFVEKDYLSFLFDELEKAKLQPQEQAELEKELQAHTHAEEIKTKIYSVLSFIHENECNIVENLTQSKLLLAAVSKYNLHVDPLAQRLSSCLIELKDIANDLTAIADTTNFDPERIAFLKERLNLIYHLQQKHKVSSVEELLKLKDEISEKLFSIQSLQSKIEEISLRLDKLKIKMLSVADILSQKRSQAIVHIEKEMKNVLANMAMASANFKVEQQKQAHFLPEGMDKIAFLFAANVGGELKEIQKAASGGELSRLMLAIKSLVVNRSMLPTIIFDEIDSGVSGDIAGKVGNILKAMAEKMQVIAITHLPQIASKSDSHFMVYKKSDNDSTQSHIQLLSKDERIEEVARMLSDEVVTESARATAKELLNFN